MKMVNMKRVVMILVIERLVLFLVVEWLVMR